MKRLFQNVKKINFTFLLLFILAILVLIVGYRSLTDDGKSNLRLEIVKFVLIGIFGGILLQWYNGKRDKDKSLNEFRKNFLTNLTHTYNKTKKARRIIEKEFKNNKESYSSYERQIIEIIDAQLELESLYNQIATLVFNWEKISNDSEKYDDELKNFLTNNLSIKWAKDAKIKKTDDGNTIKVSNKNKSLSLELDGENKVNFKTDGGLTLYLFFIKYIIKRNKFYLIKKSDYGKIYQVTPYIFSDKSIEILKQIRQMESYLNNEIIEKYKKSPNNPISNDLRIAIDMFIMAETFRENFSEHYHKCVVLIRDQILEV